MVPSVSDLLIQYSYLANDPFRTDEEEATLQSIRSRLKTIALAPPCPRQQKPTEAINGTSQ